MARIKFASAEDIPQGEMRIYEISGERVLVGNVDGTFYAIDDMCTHDGGPLGEGCLIGHEVECPRHGALFDIRNGDALTMPATSGVRSYEIVNENGDLYIAMPDE